MFDDAADTAIRDMERAGLDIEREHLVGGEIEGMKGQPELLVTLEREESKGAIARPFQEDTVAARGDLRLDEGRALPHEEHLEAVRLEEEPIGAPARLEGLVGIVEQVDVPRDARGRDQLVQGHTAGDVAFARRDAVLR